MTETSAAVAVAVLVGIGLVVIAGRRLRTRDRRALVRDLEDRLEAGMAPGTGSHLESAPTVRRLAVLEATASEGNDPTAAVVPVVRVDFETTDAPGMDLVFEYVADVLEAIHPVLTNRDDCVAHYDVEFTFGPGGLVVEGECRRVSVPPEFADRLLEDEEYRAFDLRRDVERGDRSEGPPVLWGECTTY
ncbi:hypothetical protein [Natrialba swarupiae]|uniref:Uncharacterized protein n=1 Tax=Natrialba swarupiae TaxID=2448032 RepID=A0A5D5AHC1_9EURY|nr:hypothetical protein [Natrialba swarupiae]TYT60333.1 hypothetical protein FYC77_19425 [Natrialba swarupiae]